MHSAKQEGVASDNMKRVTKEHNFDGGSIFQGESAFCRKPSEPLNFEYFHQQNYIQRLLQETLKQQSFIHSFGSTNFIWMSFQ